MSKVVNKWWFNHVGIVKVYDEVTKEEKFYIGQASGIDENYDIEYIRSFGCKFMPDLIK